MTRRSGPEKRDEVRGVLHHGLEPPLARGCRRRRRASSTRPSARVSWAAMASRIERRSSGSAPSWANSTRSRAISGSDQSSSVHMIGSGVAATALATGEADHSATRPGCRVHPRRRSRRRARTRWPRRSPPRSVPGSVTTQPMTLGCADGDDRVDAGVPHVRALRGGDEAFREVAQCLLAAGIDRLGPGQPGQAEHDEHEDHRRGAGEVAGVLGDAH